jgi:hypothetical protein
MKSRIISCPVFVKYMSNERLTRDGASVLPVRSRNRCKSKRKMLSAIFVMTLSGNYDTIIENGGDHAISTGSNN